MINKFFTKTFTVRRMGVWVGGKTTEVEVSSFLGHIQQSDPSLIEDNPQAFTSTHTMWCPVDTAVERGDTLTYNGNYYSVKSINTRDYAGKNKHLEIFANKDEKYSSV